MKLKGELEEANMAPEGTLAAPRQKHNGNFGIWVWIGKRASEGERREAMRNAQVQFSRKSFLFTIERAVH